LLKQQEASSEELEQLRGESLGQVLASARTLGANCMANRASMPAEEIDFLKVIASVDSMDWSRETWRLESRKGRGSLVWRPFYIARKMEGRTSTVDNRV